MFYNRVFVRNKRHFEDRMSLLRKPQKRNAYETELVSATGVANSQIVDTIGHFEPE